MGSTGLKVFDKTLQETNAILKDIQAEFGWDDKEIAYDVLRAVLQTLRDRLTVAEAVDLSAQLPMLVRGIYFEGWKPSRVPVKMNREKFFAEVEKKMEYELAYLTPDLVHGVMVALRRYISEGELEEIRDNLPKDLSNIFNV